MCLYPPFIGTRNNGRALYQHRMALALNSCNQYGVEVFHTNARISSEPSKLSVNLSQRKSTTFAGLFSHYLSDLTMFKSPFASTVYSTSSISPALTNFDIPNHGWVIRIPKIYVCVCVSRFH